MAPAVIDAGRPPLYSVEFTVTAASAMRIDRLNKPRQENSTMILTRSDTSIQLTYTPKEYDEFNHALVAFRKEINTTLRDQLPTLNDNDKEYWRTLNEEFIQTLDYIDRAMIVTRREGGFQLLFNVEEFEKFSDNIGFLSMDLRGFQEWYHCTGEYEKENAVEAAQDLIDIFFRLLGYKEILDS
jgi:hypothetical protein